MTPKFEAPVWSRISANAIELLKDMLHLDPAIRCSAKEVMEHQWVRTNSSTGMQGCALCVQYIGLSAWAHINSFFPFLIFIFLGGQLRW
jgi:hypothetical protein